MLKSIQVAVLFLCVQFVAYSQNEKVYRNMYDALENPKVVQILDFSVVMAELPPEIGELKNLRELHLNRHKLTTLPPEIGKLKKLRVLEIQTNKLISLPKDISKCKSMKNLDLSNNKF